MEVETAVHYICRAIFQSDEFQDAEHFLVHFGAFTDEVIEAVLAVNPQRSMAENLGNH
jgi:hypothetical protein